MTRNEIIEALRPTIEGARKMAAVANGELELKNLDKEGRILMAVLAEPDGTVAITIFDPPVENHDLEQEISTIKAVDQLRPQGSRTEDIQPSCPECIAPQEWTGAAWECVECNES